MTNSFNFPMSCLISNGRLLDQKLEVRFLCEIIHFSKYFLYGGYFCISKCLGSAVAKFVLMINTLMVNRVKVLFYQYRRTRHRAKIFIITFVTNVADAFLDHISNQVFCRKTEYTHNLCFS